nr:Rgp1 [Danio rerio]
MIEVVASMGACVFGRRGFRMSCYLHKPNVTPLYICQQ